MKNLQLIKSESFGEVRADIYSNGDEMFMTANQLCECLGESRNAFDVRLNRNNYLKEPEFSVSYKLKGTDGKMYNTRVFTEDGIYEATMLSESEKAKEFRAWIRKILKGLHKGEIKIEPKQKIPSVTEANGAAKIILPVLERAGMAPQFLAVAAQKIYEPAGISVPLEGITARESLFDCTAIARRLGILSKSGVPHNQAVSAIVAKLPIEKGEREPVPFQNNGHGGTTYQYTESVVEKVIWWLEQHGYPARIEHNGKSYAVVYEQKQSA